MDIETLKEALGSEKFAELKTFVDDLIGQRDTARNESITGRKGLKAELEKLKADQAVMLEKLGIDAPEDLANLPDARGAVEAAKQYEAKVKRLERENAELATARDEAAEKFRTSKQHAAVVDAMGRHEFLARDVVETYVSQRLVWEGDDLLYKTDDGKLVPVADGVAGVAKSRPELLKSAGTGGAGVKSASAGSTGGAKQVTRKDFEALTPGARMEHVKAGGQVVEG